MSFFRERDRNGFPIVTKAEWHAGVTPEDIADGELLKLILIVCVGIGAILALIIYLTI